MPSDPSLTVEQLSIRYATAEDVPALVELGARTYWDTYGEMDDPKDIASYLADNFRPEIVAAILKDPRITTLVAETGGTIGGYAVLKRVPAPECVLGADPIELSRFYLDKAHIGKGQGAKLMLAVHTEAALMGGRTLWLCVYFRNIRAIQFYDRLGFAKVGDMDFVFGSKTYFDPIYSAPVNVAV